MATAGTTDVGETLGAIANPQRRDDAARLTALLQRLTGEEPRMWPGNIIGFGKYHYRYASGREGDSCLVGFSPRPAEFSIYLMGIYFPDSAEPAKLLLQQLGKHRMGKACLYVRRLGDVDQAVLAQLVELSISKLREHYVQIREPFAGH